jgi:E3 ubiquitin-protein ligase HUWE1
VLLIFLTTYTIRLQVLTSKACSEEGLEDVTALLLNLSHGPDTTRETILKLLLKGAQELGSVVRQNILDLQKELQTLKAATPGTSLAATALPSTEDESQDGSDLRHAKGALIDRYVPTFYFGPFDPLSCHHFISDLLTRCPVMQVV